MTQHSIPTKRAQLTLIMLVGVAFLLVALVPMMQAAATASNGPAVRGWAQELLKQTFIAAFIGTVGVVFFMAGLLQKRRLPAEATGEVPVDQPWLARTDWASGRIAVEGSPALMATALKAMAGVWVIIALPVALRLPDLMRESAGFALLAAIFPALCALIFLAGLQQTQIARRFGEPMLHLSASPGVIGGQLAGVVRILRIIRPVPGFHVKLVCVELIRRGKSVRAVPLWQEEHQVAALLDEAATVTVVPVLFAIPSHCREASRSHTKRPIHWRLEVRAKIPGVPFQSNFAIPVYATTASRVVDRAVIDELNAAMRR